MSKHIISNSELNDMLALYIRVVFQHSSLFYDFFLNMYNLGTRFAELSQISRWTILENGTIQLVTAKGNNNRIFTIYDLSDSLYLAIVENRNLYFGFNESTCSYWMKSFIMESPIFVGNKEAKTHLFRHNRMKMLYDSGSSIQEISDYFGEIDLKNTNSYVFSEPYFYN